MEVRMIILICVIAAIILISIYSFENNINKKIDKLNDKIDDIGLKTNDIEPQHEDIYTKLNSLSSMLVDIRLSENNINNNEPKSEK